MRFYPQLRRVVPSAVFAVLALTACTESSTEPTSGAFPVKPSFAPGGSISVNLDQCANNVPRGGNCTWQNGDINGSNSEYAEGLAVPFRLSVDGLTPGTQYQIHLNYDWTAGGHKAYDFLASVDATETVNICAAGGGGTPLACAALGTASALTFPENNFPANITGSLSVTGAIAFAGSAQGGGFVGAGERQLRLYRGTINSITDPTHTDNRGDAIVDISDLDGNTEADIIVTFTPAQSSVLFTWSGHLAQSAYWDGPTSPDGSGQVSGAPWHMRTQQLQTSAGSSAGNKNQDRSIQPSAIIEPPVITVSKNAGAATVTAGSPISFTIVVSNTGAGSADGFVLNDPLPTGSGISWSIANQSGPVTCTIAAGVLRCPAAGTVSFPSGATLTVQITSPTTFASCATYNNTATVTITNGSSPPPAIAQTTVLCPLLGITKTADASAVSAGSPIGFTIAVTNTGQGAATNVTLSDPLPGGSGVDWSISPTNALCSISGSAPTQTLACNFGTLAAVNGTASVHVVSQTLAASCKAYPNTASATATNHAQVQAQATTTVNCGDIDITKVADASPVNAGEAIGFTITVKNDGDGDATNVVVTDVLPTQTGLSWSIDPAKTGCSIASGTLTCNFGTMAKDASHSVHITSPTTFASCATIPNTASVATGNDGSGQATANVVVRCPDLDITKAATVSPVNAGSPIGFTIVLTNSGQGVAKDVTLNDALPGGTGINWSLVSPVTGCGISGAPPSETLTCDFGDLASGATRTINLTSGTAFASCKEYSNTATAQATNHAQVQASASATVQCPSLTFTKTADAATVSAGSPIGFTITVSNAGPGAATGVTISDPLPTGTGIVWTDNAPECTITTNTLNCNFGNIAAGGSASVHLTSPTTGASCGTYPNTATLQATNHPQLQASATTTVNCAEIDITKVADQGTVSAGTQIGFLIKVKNTGVGTAADVTVTDNLPTTAGLSWSIDATESDAGCSITAGVLTCSFGSLATNAEKKVHIVSPTTAASCSTVNNQASVTTSNDGTDNASASVIVNCPAIDLTKVADQGTVSAGTQIGFVIKAKNTGLGTATGVTVTDNLPTTAGLSWSIDASQSDGGCSITAGVLTCNFGTLAPNAEKKVHIVSPTTAASCGTVNNEASVTTTNNGTDNASASVIVNCPVIDLTKVADQGTVSAGTQIGFVIKAKNTGLGTATDVTVTDNLPTTAGLTWSIDGSQSDAGCSIAAGVLTCNFGTLAPDAEKKVHIVSPTTAASCGTVNNQASVTTTNDGTDNASASVVVNCAEIDITKVADQGTVSAGTQIGFLIKVKNTGVGTAADVTVTDNLPTTAGLSWSIDATESDAGCSITAGVLTCSFGSLATNAEKKVHIVSPTTAASCSTVNNQASVTTSNDGTDNASASVIVNCPAIDLTKVADQGTVSAGTQIGFVIKAKNTGLGTATGVTVTDNLPTTAGLSWSIDASQSDGGCSITAGVLTCNFGTLAPNAEKKVHIVSPTTAASCSTVNNEASVTTTNNGTDNASASVIVNCPTLTITKTPDPGTAGYTVLPGGLAKFTITVTNTGLGVAKNVVITDTLPAELTTWAEDPGKNECVIASITLADQSTRQRLRCGDATDLVPTFDLPAGESFSVSVSATVPLSFLLVDPSGPGSPIEIDGNLLDSDPAAGPKDWATLGIDCLSTPKVGCDIDKPTGTTDDSFGQGAKEDTPVPSVVAGSIPNNKSDLLRFYVAKERFVTTDYLYLAWERVSEPNGTTNMDFELNQSSALTANGVTPVRTAGDLLVKYDLSRGGGSLTIGYHKWVTTGVPAVVCEAANSVPCWGKVKQLDPTEVAGASNTAAVGPVQDPIAPDAPRTLSVLTFGEAWINLQEADIFTPGACVNFGRAYLKSRSSDSFTSELKDFIAPIPISVSNCTDKFLNNKAYATASNLGTGAVSDVGQIKVSNTAGGSASLYIAPVGRQLAAADPRANATAGTGTVTESFEASALRTTPRTDGSETGVSVSSRGRESALEQLVLATGWVESSLRDQRTQRREGRRSVGLWPPVEPGHRGVT